MGDGRVIGFFILGAGAWGLSYLARLEPELSHRGTEQQCACCRNPGYWSNFRGQPNRDNLWRLPGRLRSDGLLGLEVVWLISRIPVEEEVAADFNASQDKIELVLEVVPNVDNQSTSAFSAEIASGNGPDIVGPVGLDNSNAFSDQWLDLAPYVSETSFSLVSDPALKTFFQSEVGQFGLPVGVYPSAVYYVPSLFDNAGLNYPPNRYGDKYVTPDGTVVDWNWDTLTQIARLLTIDANGRNASDGGFDRNQIVQLGFDFQWQPNLIYIASFRAGASRIVQNNLSTMPGSWKEAMKWYYDGMWGDQPFIATGTLAASPDFGADNLLTVARSQWQSYPYGMPAAMNFSVPASNSSLPHCQKATMVRSMDV